MLRINLLPAYVAQRRLNRQLVVAYAAVFAAVVVLMLLYQFAYLVPSDANEKTLADAAVQAKAYIDSENRLASNTAAGVAPIAANIQFVKDVATYNANYPNLYESIARFTSPRILYYGMAVSGSTLTINAYAPSLEELGRYLQIMYHEPDITSVAISSVPTSAQAAERIYYYKGVEIGMSGGGTATTAGGTSASGLPGVPTGVSVTLPSVVKITPSTTTPGGPGGLNSPANPIGEANGPGARGANGTPADVWTFINSDPDFNYRYFKVVTKHTDGFTFTATCALKTTFAPPAVPSGAAAVSPGRGGPGGPNNS